MKELTVELNDPTKRVFFEIQQHKAMPFLEIAAVTGIRGSALRQAVDELVREKLVTLSKATDPVNSIVSISGKYF